MELAVLHDGKQLVAVEQHLWIGQRVAVHEQQIRQKFWPSSFGMSMAAPPCLVIVSNASIAVKLQ